MPGDPRRATESQAIQVERPEHDLQPNQTWIVDSQSLLREGQVLVTGGFWRPGSAPAEMHDHKTCPFSPAGAGG